MTPRLRFRTQRPVVQAASCRRQTYIRARDLPGLIPLWPGEIDDESVPRRLELIAKLRRALREERRRGLGAHWTYDLGRHAGLLHAYKCELAALKADRTSIRHLSIAPAVNDCPGMGQKQSP